MGSAFGVADHSRLSLWQVLPAVDDQARLGTAYPGGHALERQAEKVLQAIPLDAASGMNSPA